MLRLAITFTILAIYTRPASPGIIKFSAASPAQIKYAMDNRYDDTGPGAKKPSFAYHTYGNLDDALIAFLDDPNTRLPEFERSRALAHLYAKNRYYENVVSGKPGDAAAYLAWRSKMVPKVLLSYRYGKYDDESKLDLFNIKDQRIGFKEDSPHPLSPYQYNNYHHKETYEYRPHPDVEFSDIHNRETGDLKSAQEMRDGSSAVHGYFVAEQSGGGRGHGPRAGGRGRRLGEHAGPAGSGQRRPQDTRSPDPRHGYHIQHTYRGLPIQRVRQQTTKFLPH